MKRLNKKLKVESLEKRELMAGNVSIFAQGTDLFIVGDSARNHVQVTQPSAGVLKISGVTIGGAATKINGVNNATATITGKLSSVHISMNGGADQVDFGTGSGKVINVPVDLLVNMGAGDDLLTVRDTKVGRDLIINTGTGKDTTVIQSTTVADDLAVYDPASIYSGDRDTLSINQSTVKDQIEVTFRGGKDAVKINSTVAGGIYASLGAGDDTFSMTNTKHGRKFDIDGGSGYDDFFVPVYNNTRYLGRNFEKVNNR